MNDPADAIRVLHVDDEPDLVDMTASFLKREDDRIAVRTATSAAEGLEVLEEEPVDCVVSDYDMPGRNGIEFLRAVRETFPDLPFVLYTGKGSEEVASDAISAGVTDYLQKESGTDQYAVLANRITNVVESYRSQRELAERNRDLRRYKHMINSMREAACIYDEDGRFVVVNEYLADWYDTSREALEGERGSLIPAIREQAGDEDPYRALLDGRRDHLSGQLEAEFPGHGHAVLEYQLTPLWADGTVKGVVGVARDVTERTERERELRRNKRAMDEAPVGITITDPDREDNPIIYANRSFREVTGYPESEVLGRNCRFLQGEATDPEPVAAMRDAIDGENRVSVELRNYRKDGSEFWNRVSIAPVHDDDGSVANYVGFQQEITGRKRREGELERTNALLSTLIRTLPVGVLAEDGSRNVLTVNERLFELFDMPATREEVVGADCERIAGEVSDLFVDPDGFVRRIDELIAERESTRAEELSLRDGRTFARDHEPIELPDGDGHLWVYRDITARKERERRRETTIEFLQRLYDVATDGTLDATGKITRLLEIGPELVGLPNGYLTRIEEGDEAGAGTQRVIEASGDHELLQPGDSCPLVRSYCRKTIETDNVVAMHDVLAAGWRGDPAYELFGLDQYIGTRITVDGELYGTVFFASETARDEPFTDAERTFVRLMSQLVSYELERDRARSRLETRKERLEEQYRTLFEEAPVMAVLTRADGGRPIVEDCNEQFVDLLGYDREAVLDRDLSEFYTPESTEKLLDEGGYRRSLEGAFTRERRDLLTADGEVVKTLLRAVPRRDAAGEVVGTLAIYVDITEREQIREANERLEEFTSVVSHDLRNPLNVAEGRLELAREECESDHLDGVARAHERMKVLIDDLLALAREGGGADEAGPADFGDVVESCWANVATADATLAIDLDRTLRADAGRLQQLLENLVRNAVEHGGDDVTVRIGELPDGFCVEDDGPGIPESERDDVFDAGYSTSEGGTGFGLSIVEQVVDAHGWTLDVTESEGGGARFEITGVEFVE